MPAILRETLLYPYTTGAFFVQAAQMSGGWPAVDDFYDRMPESTEQILHPDKYAAGEAPVEVTLPKDLAKDLGNGLDRAARGHVRRVPDGHLAHRGRRRRGDGHGGRAPAGAATASR